MRGQIVSIRRVFLVLIRVVLTRFEDQQKLISDRNCQVQIESALRVLRRLIEPTNDRDEQSEASILLFEGLIEFPWISIIEWLSLIHI